MTSREKDIQVRVLIDGEVMEIMTFANEYRNLMMLIYDHIYEEGFGECGGMGRCSTCIVEVQNIQQPFNEFHRNADQTFLKSSETRENVYLSCQILADESIDGLEVKVLQDAK